MPVSSTGKRLPPQDVEAQDALIGACLLSTEALDESRLIVRAEDFVGQQYQQCWETMLLLRDAGEAVNVITVAPGIQIAKSLEWLHELQNRVPAISHVASYANRVLQVAKSRSLIYFGAELADAGYAGLDASAVAARLGAQLIDDERLRRNERGDLRGYYDDIATIDTGEERDDAQPWIAHGWLRRGQRFMCVARAGLGKSTLLRQLAFCAEAGVHPLTGQKQNRKARALVVEAEAGAWDITASMRDILLPLRRILAAESAFSLPRPALLHRAGGLNLREPSGLAALEAAIQRHRPELVVLGPVKYLHVMQPGENYETATLALHGILNTLIERYGVALALEAHFSRGDHGAPGGSERWVDWPDVGITMHPPEDDITRHMLVGGAGEEVTVKQFRIPRDPGIWVPHSLIRGAARHLPWTIDDRPDPQKPHLSIFASRYGGVPAGTYSVGVQEQF